VVWELGGWSVYDDDDDEDSGDADDSAVAVVVVVVVVVSICNNPASLALRFRDTTTATFPSSPSSSFSRSSTFPSSLSSSGIPNSGTKSQELHKTLTM
jgi:hypothetical protein